MPIQLFAALNVKMEEHAFPLVCAHVQKVGLDFDVNKVTLANNLETIVAT